MLVALLDILGFSDIVKNNSNEDLLRHHNNIRLYVQLWMAEQNTTIQNGRTVPDISNCPINSAFMSDSIIFWVENDNVLHWKQLIKLINHLMAMCHSMAGIFMRGAVTYGDFYYDNSGTIRGAGSMSVHSLMGGKALVQLHEIEKSIDEATCVLTEEAINAFMRLDTEVYEELLNANRIIQYSVQTKSGPQNSVCVNWLNRFIRDEEIVEGFSMHNKTVSVPSVQRKLDNTLAFLNYVKGNNLIINPTIQKRSYCGNRI